MKLFRKKATPTHHPWFPGLTPEQERLARTIISAKSFGIITAQDAQRAFVRYLGLNIVG